MIFIYIWALARPPLCNAPYIYMVIYIEKKYNKNIKAFFILNFSMEYLKLKFSYFDYRI